MVLVVWVGLEFCCGVGLLKFDLGLDTLCLGWVVVVLFVVGFEVVLGFDYFGVGWVCGGIIGFAGCVVLGCCVWVWLGLVGLVGFWFCGGLCV